MQNIQAKYNQTSSKTFMRSLKLCFTTSAYTQVQVFLEALSRTASCCAEIILSGFIRSLVSFSVSLCRSFEITALTCFMVGSVWSLASPTFDSRFIISDHCPLPLRFLCLCNFLQRLLGVSRMVGNLVVPTEKARDSVFNMTRLLFFSRCCVNGQSHFIRSGVITWCFVFLF